MTTTLKVDRGNRLRLLGGSVLQAVGEQWKPAICLRNREIPQREQGRKRVQPGPVSWCFVLCLANRLEDGAEVGTPFIQLAVALRRSGRGCAERGERALRNTQRYVPCGEAWAESAY